MKPLAIIFMAFGLAACALPETRVTTGSSPPGLIVEGAPAGSSLYVDTILMGAASEFNGRPKVLTILEGVHEIEVKAGGTTLFHEKALVSAGEVHKVRISGGAVP